MQSSPPTILTLNAQADDECSALSSSQKRLLDQGLLTLAEGDFQTRWQASKQIVKLGASVIPDLWTLLQASMSRTGPEEWDEDCDDALELQWFIARILGELRHSAAIKILMELIQRADAEVAAIAALSLAQSGELALPALESLLTKRETRLWAVQSLGQMGLSSAIPRLLQVVEDSDPGVRAAAIQALIAFRDERIPSVLKTALADPVSQVRLAALTGIGGTSGQQRGAELVDLVIPLLKDLKLDVAIQAAIVLGKLQHPQAIPALESLVEDALIPLSLKIQALRSLAWYESEAALIVLGRQLHVCLSLKANRLAEAEIRALSLEASRLLGRTELRSLQPLATEILISALPRVEECQTEDMTAPESNEVEIQSAIALGLAQLGSPQAFDRLVPLLAIPSSTLRLHLLAALKRLEPEMGTHRLLMKKQQVNPILAQGIDFVLAEWDGSAP